MSSPLPLDIVGHNFKVPTDLRLNVGVNPTFILEKNGVVDYVVINGFLINVKAKKGLFKNAMLIR